MWGKLSWGERGVLAFTWSPHPQPYRQWQPQTLGCFHRLKIRSLGEEVTCRALVGVGGRGSPRSTGSRCCSISHPGWAPGAVGLPHLSGLP